MFEFEQKDPNRKVYVCAIAFTDERGTGFQENLNGNVIISLFNSKKVNNMVNDTTGIYCAPVSGCLTICR